MEGGAVVATLLGQFHHVADVVGRGVGQQLDHDVAEAGRDHRLLVPHLLDRQRRRVDTRRAGRRTACLGRRGCDGGQTRREHERDRGDERSHAGMVTRPAASPHEARGRQRSNVLDANGQWE